MDLRWPWELSGMSTETAAVESPADAFDLTGRRVIVTGASRGIGRATAVAFAQAGADVLIVARSASGLEETAQLARGAGRRVEALPLDLEPPEAATECIATAADRLGGIDVLVNNAGADSFAPIEELAVADFRRVIDLDLQSCWLLMKEASPHLEDGGGKVINVASIMGTVAMRDESAYVAAKHGLIGVTRAIGLEWARRGVQVNAIAPGFVETAMGTPDHEGFRKWIKRNTPMGRWAQPVEIAWPTLFLASRASDFMTGQVLVVDGGWTAQ